MNGDPDSRVSVGIINLRDTSSVLMAARPPISCLGETIEESPK